MQARSEIQFKVGDKAVYPAQGVAEVVNIEEKDIAGNRQRFYVLRILDTDRKIMVPVSNASAVGLRQVISEQEIREIFDILRERTIAFDNQTWNRRYRGFMDKIKTGSIYDVAEVLRDLYRLKTDKQLSFGERRMLDTARSLIVKEIAISRDQTEEQVKAEIEAIFMANSNVTPGSVVILGSARSAPRPVILGSARERSPTPFPGGWGPCPRRRSGLAAARPHLDGRQRWQGEIDPPRAVLEDAGHLSDVAGQQADHLDASVRAGDLRREALRHEADEEARGHQHRLRGDRLAARGAVALGPGGQVLLRVVGEEIVRGPGVTGIAVDAAHPLDELAHGAVRRGVGRATPAPAEREHDADERGGSSHGAAGGSALASRRGAVHRFTPAPLRPARRPGAAPRRARWRPRWPG